MIDASWWQIPLHMGPRSRRGEGSALGAVTSLSVSVAAVLREMKGLVEEWALPDMRSARCAARHITDVRAFAG